MAVFTHPRGGVPSNWWQARRTALIIALAAPAMWLPSFMAVFAIWAGTFGAPFHPGFMAVIRSVSVSGILIGQVAVVAGVVAAFAHWRLRKAAA